MTHLDSSRKRSSACGYEDVYPLSDSVQHLNLNELDNFLIDSLVDLHWKDEADEIDHDSLASSHDATTHLSQSTDSMKTSFSSETQCLAEEAKPTKPKAKRRPPPYKLLPTAPRLLKGDIRRQYGRMYANVLNAFDCELMMSFLSTFASRSVKMVNEITALPNPMSESNDRSCSFEVDGKDAIACFLLATRQIAPDSVVKLGETRIKTRSDTNLIELECTFSVQGMLLYDLPPDNVLKKVFAVLETVRNEHFYAVGAKRLKAIQDGLREEEASDESKVEAYKRRTSVNTVELLKQQFDPCKVYTDHEGRYHPLLTRPTALELEGVLTFVIDEHKRIQKIHFVR